MPLLKIDERFLYFFLLCLLFLVTEDFLLLTLEEFLEELAVCLEDCLECFCLSRFDFCSIYFLWYFIRFCN